jgi:hypothetical protein
VAGSEPSPRTRAAAARVARAERRPGLDEASASRLGRAVGACGDGGGARV